MVRGRRWAWPCLLRVLPASALPAHEELAPAGQTDTWPAVRDAQWRRAAWTILEAMIPLGVKVLMCEEGVRVTPEMVEAGVAAYLDWDSQDEYSLDEFAKSLYLAMNRANPPSWRHE